MKNTAVTLNQVRSWAECHRGDYLARARTPRQREIGNDPLVMEAYIQYWMGYNYLNPKMVRNKDFEEYTYDAFLEVILGIWFNDVVNDFEGVLDPTLGLLMKVRKKYGKSKW